MPKIVIYTTGMCPYCYAAKKLLNEKGAPFEEIDVTFDPAQRKEMAAKAGRSTVPQIWIGDTHVGGCDELMALNFEGKLDGMLGA